MYIKMCITLFHKIIYNEYNCKKEYPYIDINNQFSKYVEFENDQDAELGNVLTLEIARPAGTTSAPVVRYPKAKESKMYQLIMVDYDKLRMNKGDWLIWNVESISGEVLKTGFNENPEDPGALKVKSACKIE